MCVGAVQDERERERERAAIVDDDLSFSSKSDDGRTQYWKRRGTQFVRFGMCTIEYQIFLVCVCV